IVGGGDTFTVEAVGTYPGGATYHVVAILELRDGKVFRGRTYFAAPFEAPEWRAPYVEPMVPSDGDGSQGSGRSELDAFLDATISLQVDAETATWLPRSATSPPPGRSMAAPPSRTSSA
ncbi:MAG TPA: hypothetical protein VNN79_19410, partial [Actinomycetota bacterium]|nr:hypothetical protein [Actinomycetota bacterium]